MNPDALVNDLDVVDGGFWRFIFDYYEVYRDDVNGLFPSNFSMQFKIRISSGGLWRILIVIMAMLPCFGELWTLLIIIMKMKVEFIQILEAD